MSVLSFLIPIKSKPNSTQLSEGGIKGFNFLIWLTEIGVIALFFYSAICIDLKQGFKVCGVCLFKTISIEFLIAGAAYAIGALAGFLFGIPKLIPQQDTTNTNKVSLRYGDNDHLSEISDWLTKIIVGVGLTQLTKIPGYLESLGDYIKPSLGDNRTGGIVAVSICLYFLITGFLISYLWTRLYFRKMLTEVEKEINKLFELQDDLGQLDLVPNIKGDNNISEKDKQKLYEYTKLVKSTKSEDEYDFNNWYYIGIEHYNNNENEYSIACMKRAIEKDAKNINVTDAYVFIANAYANIKSYDNAIEACDKAIQINQKNDVAWSVKCYSLIKLGKYQEALITCDKTLELIPDDDYAYYNKACSYALLGDKENMLINLKKAIEITAQFKIDAKTDEDLKNYWNDEDFKKLCE